MRSSDTSIHGASHPPLAKGGRGDFDPSTHVSIRPNRPQTTSAPGSLHRRLASLFFLVFVLAVTLPTFAQQPSREREALRRSQQQAAKLQQDNAALQREKTETEAKLKSAEAELGKLKGQASKLKKATSSLEAAEKDNAELKSKLAAAEERLKDSSQKSQEQVAALRQELVLMQRSVAEYKLQSEQEAGKLRDSVERETGRAAACEAKNQQLYSVTMDLITRYKANRGAWEKFLLSEPFTGLKSAQVENLLEDFKDRAADASVSSR